MKKRILFISLMVALFVCLLAFSVSAAETKEIDGITYYLDGSSASVTNANKSCTLETVIIPETVTSGTTTYSVTSINQEAFCQNKNIKYLSLPSTITYVGPSAFRECSNLLFVDFNDNQNNVNFDNWGHFKDCTSLKAVSMPDKTQTITNRIFSGCTNLKAVYLPSATKVIESNGYSPNGAFSKCNNMYFVNEPFEVRDENGNFYDTNFVMPTRPDVYFFPSNLQKIYERDSGVGFEECYNLNPVMVFPTTLTKLWINDGVFYNCGKTGSTFTVVFLGDMTDVRIGMRESRAKGVSYVFANPADTDLSKVNIIDTSPAYSPTLGGSEYIYFCHSTNPNGNSFKLFNLGGGSDASQYTNDNVTWETKTTHIQNPKAASSQPATCTESAMTFKTCFCNAKYDITEDKENPALGHDYDFSTITAMTYADYTKDGVITCGCHRADCEGVKAEVVKNTYLFTYNGYSRNDEGDMCVGYTVNAEFLEYYKAVNTSFSFGLVSTVIDFDDEGVILDGEDNPLAPDYEGKVMSLDLTEKTGFSAYEMIITGFGEAYKDLFLAMNLYVIDGENTSYIWNNAESGTNAVVNYKQYSAIPAYQQQKSTSIEVLFLCHILIIFSLNFKVSLRMRTNRANLRSLLANNNMTTVRALPNSVIITREYKTTLNICKKLLISFLMLLFNLCNLFK